MPEKGRQCLCRQNKALGDKAWWAGGGEGEKNVQDDCCMSPRLRVIMGEEIAYRQ